LSNILATVGAEENFLVYCHLTNCHTINGFAQKYKNEVNQLISLAKLSNILEMIGAEERY
jgi:hypothetical protein